MMTINSSILSANQRKHLLAHYIHVAITVLKGINSKDIIHVHLHTCSYSVCDEIVLFCLFAIYDLFRPCNMLFIS